MRLEGGRREGGRVVVQVVMGEMIVAVMSALVVLTVVLVVVSGRCRGERGNGGSCCQSGGEGFHDGMVEGSGRSVRREEQQEKGLLHD